MYTYYTRCTPGTTPYSGAYTNRHTCLLDFPIVQNTCDEQLLPAPRTPLLGGFFVGAHVGRLLVGHLVGFIVGDHVGAFVVGDIVGLLVGRVVGSPAMIRRWLVMKGLCGSRTDRSA